MTRQRQEYLLELTGNSTGAVKALSATTRAAKSLNAEQSLASKSIRRYNQDVQNSTTLSRNFGRALGGLSLLTLARNFVQTADAMTLLNGRLKLVVSGTSEFNKIQRELFRGAQDARADLEAYSSFYVRLAQRMGTAKTAGLELTQITSLVSKSLALGGATAKETSASLLQLSQGLASGVLRGDEFRSLSENAVGLMAAIADGAGVTQARLRELSIEGALTTEYILTALQKSAPLIRAQFASLPVTFGQSIQILSNEAQKGIASLNDVYGVTETLGEGVIYLSQNLDVLVTGFGLLAGTVAANSLISFTQSIRAASSATVSNTTVLINENKALLASNANSIRATREKIALAKASLVDAKAKGSAAVATKRLEIAEQKLVGIQAKRLVLSKSLNASMNQGAAAITRQTFAVRAMGVASRGAAAGVALLGGPVGVAAIAAFALYSFAKSAKSAEDQSLDLRSRLEDLGVEFPELTDKVNGFNEAMQDRTMLDLNEKLAKSQEELRKTSESYEELHRLQSLMEEGSTGGAAWWGDNAEAVEFYNEKLAALGTNMGLVALEAEILSERIAQQEEHLQKVAAARQAEADFLKTHTQAQLTEKKAIDELNESITAEIVKRKEQLVELARLQKIKQSLIQSDGLNAVSVEVVTQKINKLTKAVDSNSNAATTSLGVVDKVIKKRADLVKKMADLKAAYGREGTVLKDLQGEYARTKAELDKLNESNKTTADLIKEVIAKYKAETVSLKETKKAIEDLTGSRVAANAVVKSSNLEQIAAQRATDEVTAALDEQLHIIRLTATEGENAAEVYRLMKAAADSNGTSIAKMTASQKASIVALVEAKDAAEKFNERLDGISQTLAGVIVNGDSLRDALKSLWKQLLFDLVASGLREAILQTFNLFDGNASTNFSWGAVFNASKQGAGFGGSSGAPSGSPSGTPSVSTQFVNSLGGKVGLTSTQSTAALAGAGAVFNIYNGAQAGGVGGGLQVANGGIQAYNAYQAYTGGTAATGNMVNGLGMAGNAFGIYNGIKQGGAMGYGSAALNAYQLYGTGAGMGLWGQAAAYQGANVSGIIANSGYANTLVNPNFMNYTSQGLNTAGMGVQTVPVGSATVATGTTQAGNGLSALGTAGAVAGVAGGVYGMYSGVQQGGARGAATFGAGAMGTYAGAAALSGGSTAVLGAMGPYGWAAMAILALAGMGGARDYDQILQEDYMPKLLGQQGAGHALGENGEVGFDGGNTAVFGANYGIQGSGLTAQQLSDGGAQGNGGFFTGAQRTLDGFEEALRAAGFDSLNSDFGTLRVLDKDKNVEDIKAVWAEYAAGLDEAVTYGEVFETAIHNGLIDPSNLFFENFATGFGQSAFEAKDSLLAVDESFDSMVANGMSGQDALFNSISEHYQIAVEDAKLFVEQSGVAAEQWEQQFRDASGGALEEILNFNAEGVTAFESSFDAMSISAQENFDSIATGMASLTDRASIEARRMAAAYSGQTTYSLAVSNSASAYHLGEYSSALSSSKTFTVPHGGSSLSGGDQLFTIGAVPDREEISVSQTGTIDKIYAAVQSGGVSSNDTSHLLSAVSELIAVQKETNQHLSELKNDARY